MRPEPHRSALEKHFPTLTVLALALLASAAIEAADFRGLDWGASKSEVLGHETYLLHHDIEGEIAYWNFEFGGVEAGLVYTFEGDRLARARFISRHRTPNPEDDLADYARFRDHLDEHFGKHASESWVWADGATHAESERTAEALTSGRAELVSLWELETSTIKLLIAGGDGEIKTLRAVFAPQ